MTVEGLELIKKYEGCKLKAYKCPAGIYTIGFGNTKYPNGEKVKEGDEITQQQADELFKDTLDKFDYQVKMILGDRLRTILKETSISALVSLAYNIGVGAFAKSTLLKVIKENKNDLKGIVNQWVRWNRAGGKELKGLTNRRFEEVVLYVEGVLSQYSIDEKLKKFPYLYIPNEKEKNNESLMRVINMLKNKGVI